MGARAASSHTGALAGNDKIYEDVFKQSGVIRARSLRDLLEFARGIPVLPTPKGNNVVIITGAGGSGVLLSDACVDNGLSLMAMPQDLDAAFRKFIPPFGAAGNPVDITGGEPPATYQNTVRLGLEDPRIHALILGYWHTIITPPMVFARLMVEVVDQMRAKGIENPWWPLLPVTWRLRRLPNTCINMAFRPTHIRLRYRSPCWAQSTSGRAAPG
jgi:acyl-CoA synthetase (NDP forming)